ncbi:MAG: hypothetical protein PHP00_03455 [Thiotrichaceae bacterium]|nr:hypothetical protein [Thiotrichaceae bacterium]
MHTSEGIEKVMGSAESARIFLFESGFTELSELSKIKPSARENIKLFNSENQ